MYNKLFQYIAAPSVPPSDSLDVASPQAAAEQGRYKSQGSTLMGDFEEAFREAKAYLDEGLPFWCDVFLRPKDKEFCDFIKEKGYEVYYLYFFEFSEGVYSPLNYQPDELEAMANARYEKLNTKFN